MSSREDIPQPEIERQPLPWDLGISPPSSNSLGSSRTQSNSHWVWCQLEGNAVYVLDSFGLNCTQALQLYQERFTRVPSHSRLICAISNREHGSWDFTPKWHCIFLEEWSMQQVFICEYFFGEIDDYRCKPDHVKGGVLWYISPQKYWIVHSFFNYSFFASKAPVSTEQLAGVLKMFLASFLGMAIITPNFTAISTKIFDLHILAPLSPWKNCKNYETMLYLMSCTWGCWKLQTT